MTQVNFAADLDQAEGEEGGIDEEKKKKMMTMIVTMNMTATIRSIGRQRWIYLWIEITQRFAG